MYRYILFLILIVNIFAEEKVVELDIGTVIGEKYWDGDFYEFYGVPYATAPKGRDRFKVSKYLCSRNAGWCIYKYKLKEVQC